MGKCYNCGKPTPDDQRFCSESCKNKVICADCHHDKFVNWKLCNTCGKAVLKDNLQTIKRLREDNRLIRLMIKYNPNKPVEPNNETKSNKE